jgi:long-chain acyl-CoA synthetase
MSVLLCKIHEQAPDEIALMQKDRCILYGDLPGLIQSFSERIKHYRCVALATDNQIEWILWDLAALKAGIALVPLPPFFTQEQKEHALKSSGCDAIITPDGIISLSNAPVSLPTSTAKITYTSGTTGTPKGVCLSASAMDAVAQSIVHMLGRDMAGIHASVLPFGVLLENVAGVYATLMAGGTVLLNSLDAFGKNYEHLHAIIKASKATSVILVPEILRVLMGQVVQNGPLPSLCYVAVGGSKVSPSLVAQAREIGLPVYEGYGLSECASVVSLNTPCKDKVGSVGTLLPHIQASAENGEIVVKNIGFLGYVGEGAPDLILTGDLGVIDEDGFLTITGRKKNVLITSYGRNIAPEWVESELLSQPEIAQAVVYGDGESSLSAFIVPSFVSANIEDAITRANKRLPDYAQIKQFNRVPAFSPNDGTLTGTGRPRRSRILQLYKKEKSMSFYDRLTKETESARKELYSVPQLVEALSGNITRETYIAYLTEAYHHVRHTVRFMMAMGAHLPENKKWLHDAIAEYIEEEKGHEEWILNDIAAAGDDKEAARNATPHLETQVLVSYNYDYIARKNPVGFLGMVFMLESTSIQIANKGADAVKSKLGLPQNAFTYLYSHGALDVEHLKFYENLVNQITDPSDQAAIIEVAQNTFRLFANVLRSIPGARVMQHAA